MQSILLLGSCVQLFSAKDKINQPKDKREGHGGTREPIARD